MPEKPLISVLIVNYQSRGDVLRSVAQLKLLRNSYVVEVLVANNDVEKFPENDEVRVIEIGSNIGFGSAHNALAEKACGDILFFLNPDTHTYSEDLYQITAHLSEYDIVAPHIIGREGQEESWSYGKTITPGRILFRQLGNSSHEVEGELQGVQRVTGAAFFMKRERFLAVGGFDERFFLYYEDVDLCKRIIDDGGKIVLVPNMTIAHDGGKSSSEKKQQKRHYYTAQRQYFTKHYGETIAKGIDLIRRLTQRL